MKKLLLASCSIAALIAVSPMAFGQCGGLFPSGSVCGNPTATTTTPRAMPLGQTPPNVVTLGADPTGVVDASDIIQNNINLHGGLYFPCGTYKVTRPIVITATPVAVLGPEAEAADNNTCVVIMRSDFDGGATFSTPSINPVGKTTFKNLRIDHEIPSATVTVSIATPAVVSWTAHGIPAEYPVVLETTGALPTGMSPEALYYVASCGLTANSFQLADTPAHAAACTNLINTSGTQSGTHTGIRANTATGIASGENDLFMAGNVRVSNHGNGWQLGGVNLGRMFNTSAVANFSNGFVVVQGNPLVPLQWIFQGHTSAATNNGLGFIVINNAGTTGPIWEDIPYCYANAGGCIYLTGVQALSDVRIANLYSSSDGGPAIRIDNAGTSVMIERIWLESGQNGKSGRNIQVPYVNNLPAIYFTSNLTYGGAWPQLNNIYAQRCGGPCIGVDASWTGLGMTINSSTVFDAGYLSGAGAPGIQLLRTTAKYDLNGVRSGRNAQTDQTIGVQVAVGANAKITGGNFSDNPTGGCVADDSALIFTDGAANCVGQSVPIALETIIRPLAANTTGNGITLTNPTAATAGNQRLSPGILLTGQGWKTNATAASQPVDWFVYTQPIQGAANPSTSIVFSSQINGGGLGPKVNFNEDGAGTTSVQVLSTGTTRIDQYVNGAIQGFYASTIGSVFFGSVTNIPVAFYSNNAEHARLHASGGYSVGNTTDPGIGSFALGAGPAILSGPTSTTLQLGAVDGASPTSQTLQAQSVSAGTSNTAGVNWTVNASRGTGTGAGGNIIFQVAPAGGSGSSQNTFIQAMVIDSIGHVRVGNNTAPALTGCGGGSPAITGDDTAGEVTMGTTATGCVITFNKAYASAPYCVVTWQATPLASQSWTVSTTAITTVQTSTSSNKLNYVCRARNAG